MNAYDEFQTSGHVWPTSIPIVPYQTFQELPPQEAEVLDSLERQMSVFAAGHKTALEEVRRNFVADSQVMTFLNDHRTLPQLLLEAVPQLKMSFGSGAIFALRAPIDEAGARALYAVAMWPGKVTDARKALARFDDTWWLANLRRASGYLTFTYELV